MFNMPRKFFGFIGVFTLVLGTPTMLKATEFNPSSKMTSEQRSEYQQAEKDFKIANNIIENNNNITSYSGNSCSATGTASGRLGAAKYYGDVWYEPSNISIIPTGHVGIYWSETIGVEALGNGVVTFRTDRTVCANTRKMDILTLSVASQDRASNWAYSKRGVKYDYSYWDNRSWPLQVGVNNQGDFNCSGLVWSAYYATTGTDLDANGGDAVYPVDILNSSETRVYERIW